MKYFEYKTRNRATGKIFKGIITSDDIEGAEDTLKRRGEDIIEVYDLKDFLGIRQRIYNISLKPGKKVKLEFFTMLKFMLESGMSLHESLVAIRDSSINKSLRGLAGKTADEVRKGASLSAAMRKSGYFENSVIMQVSAGEESGSVTDTISRIIIRMQREIEFKSKIKSAMIYPIVICVVMVIVLWVMLTVVIPPLAETLVSMGGNLPLITKIVIGASKAMRVCTPYMLILGVLTVIAYKTAVKNAEIRIKADTYKLKIPIVGSMLQKTELSRFCSNLSAMQKSGITLVTSLKTVMTAIKNQRIAQDVQKACRLVEISGMNLSAALMKSGNFPALMLQLVEVGINSGQICDVLDRISEQFESEVDTGLKRITSIIEPSLIVVVGVMAGIIVASIFIPMMEMSDFI